MVKIAAMGDNVVDCYVAHGQMFPGGNCVNVSVFAKRFGASSAYIGRVGRDSAGDLIWNALRAEGVDVTHLERGGGSTAYCLIGHRSGDRVFLSSDMGVSMFAPTVDELAALEGCDAVHVGQSSGLDEFVATVAARTHLSYDFSYRRDAGHRRAIGPHCFLASVSGGDMEPGEVDEVLAELRQAGAQWVLVTRGAKGAALVGPAGRFDVGAVPCEVVDTLGAGDSFIARVLVGLLAGEAPGACLDAAAEAAARTCGYLSAIGYGAPIEIGPNTATLVRSASATCPV